MDKKFLDNMYESCKEAVFVDEEFFYLLENSETEEEKEFYMNMKNFFLQKGMEKIIEEKVF